VLIGKKVVEHGINLWNQIAKSEIRNPKTDTNAKFEFKNGNKEI